MIACTCIICGATKWRHPSKANKYTNTYCSRECQKKSYENRKVHIKCTQCGKELIRHSFLGKPTKKSRLKFCSNYCSGKYYSSKLTQYTHYYKPDPKTKETLKCESCGVSFIRYKSQRKRKHTYCSHKCFGKSLAKTTCKNGHALTDESRYTNRSCKICVSINRAKIYHNNKVNVTDDYIKILIVQNKKVSSIKRNDIPEEVIALYRTLYLLKEEARNGKHQDCK